jgi:SNF2 family DNA or RNA helicase
MEIDESRKEWFPRHYQERGIKHLLEMGSGQLYLNPGYGKTSICLATAMEIMKDDPRPILVVCPLRPAHTVWPLEIDKWENFSKLTYTVLHGPRKDELYKEKSDIYILNYDGIKWFAGKMEKDPKEFSVIILDEVTYIKDSSTQRFKFLLPIAKKIPRRWGLTGTPASNSLMDVFTPCAIIDRGATFGDYFTNFRASFFEQGYQEYQWTLKEGAEEAIYDKLSVSCLRIEEDDLLDLPELLINDVRVELPVEARKMYNSLERNLFLEMEEGTITAVNSAVGVMKLQQIANGGIYLDSENPEEERQTQHLHTSKVDSVKEIIDDLGGSGAIVVYHFRHDLDRLREIYPAAPILGGGTSAQRTIEIIDEWNRGRHEVLIAHAQSIGHGLNLQEFGTDIIWASLTYSRELYDQLIARLYRQGNSRKHVMVHRLIAMDTVDEDIIKVLDTKGQTQKALLDGIRARQMCGD